MALDAGAPKPDYMLRYGIPYFFFLISLEWVVTKVINYRRAEGKDKVLVDFRLNDSVVSTLLGSFQSMFITMCELAGIFVDVAAYTWVYENARLIDWKPSEHVYLAFFAALVVKDCGYYWAHRCMHTWHVMWTAHSVHHSGEDYNLPTALRQGATQPFFTWIFYIPVRRSLAVHARVHGCACACATLLTVPPVRPGVCLPFAARCRWPSWHCTAGRSAGHSPGHIQRALADQHHVHVSRGCCARACVSMLHVYW